MSLGIGEDARFDEAVVANLKAQLYLFDLHRKCKICKYEGHLVIRSFNKLQSLILMLSLKCILTT